MYERGIDLFQYPVAFELWNIYLSKFVDRYVGIRLSPNQTCADGHVMLQGGSKLERTRDLFEQALEKCPEKFCKPLFLMCAQLEEEHGLAKRAMNIYDRAASAVQDADKFDVSIQRGRRRRPILTWHCRPRCILFTSPRRRPTTVFPPPDPSTSEPSKSCQTGRRQKCVCVSPRWKGSWAKSIEPEPSMHTHRSSVIREHIPNSGNNGIPSKVSLGIWSCSRKYC